jgi:hypothetical protein
MLATGAGVAVTEGMKVRGVALGALVGTPADGAPHAVSNWVRRTAAVMKRICFVTFGSLKNIPSNKNDSGVSPPESF